MSAVVALLPVFESRDSGINSGIIIILFNISVIGDGGKRSTED